MKEKPVIYQIFTRLFGNTTKSVVPDGDITQNGCGKLNDIDHATLRRIHQMGVTHVWYTGVIRHATTTDYSAYGIPVQTPSPITMTWTPTSLRMSTRGWRSFSPW